MDEKEAEACPVMGTIFLVLCLLVIMYRSHRLQPMYLCNAVGSGVVWPHILVRYAD